MTSVAAAGLFLAMVAAQPLVDIQYQALMNVYASAGSIINDELFFIFWTQKKICFFLQKFTHRV
jgi:hypothetical protein